LRHALQRLLRGCYLPPLRALYHFQSRQGHLHRHAPPSLPPPPRLRPWHENIFDVTMDDEPPDDPYQLALWKQVMSLRKALILAT